MTHTNKVNCNLHTLFMPFIYSGIVYFVSNYFYKKTKNKIKFQISVFLYYIFYYFTIDIYITLLFIKYYLFFHYLIYSFTINYETKYLKYSIYIFLFSLILQEVLGHRMTNDLPSRFNVKTLICSLLHAKFFSIYHLL